MAFDTLDFWGPLLAGAGGALAAAGLGRVSIPRQSAKGGWGRVRPGAMHWSGLVLASGLASLMAWVGLFVGSDRADAVGQMRILWSLTGAFAVGAALCLLQMRKIARTNVEWRGATIRYRLNGMWVERQLTAVTTLKQSFSGWICIGFEDASILQLDPYAKGSEALCRRISEIAGRAMSDMADAASPRTDP